MEERAESSCDGREDASLAVKRLAREAGFDLVGIAAAEPLDPGPLDRWIENGFHSRMEWMARSRDARVDPRAVLPQVRSVLCLAVNYFHPGSTSLPGGGKISRFAWGRDYHKVLKARLKKLRLLLARDFPALRIFGGVDSVPIMEKAWAVRAGLGWMGKNGLLITREFGSWVFLATLLTDLDLRPDAPVPDHCQECALCMKACPTEAIVSLGVVDARRCAAANTIESGDAWSRTIAKRSGGWIFGCDACQDACPFSARAAAISEETAFSPRKLLMRMTLDQIIELDEKRFEELTEGSSLRRAGVDLLRRNARAAAVDDGSGSGA